MLQLKDIRKTYGEGESAVEALKGVSLAFRKSEFVAILGPSGCGKTTMLNILGGLDRYTSGDLMIDGKSTQLFKPFEWDAYRNNCVGFIFQNYNLISHQTILENVELALALSGVSIQERKRRATAALEDVGLGGMLKKKPNQMSGGQMQRVAIARAIVNDPEIILADEPTGALDSKNSVQIIELLREISKTRLVVMVTHNEDLAEEYTSRIIKMVDGEITSDSAEYLPTLEETLANNMIYVAEPEPDVEGLTEVESKKVLAKHKKLQIKKQKASISKTSMSIGTSFRLSLKNLFTKKGRTFLTAFAGSIGIVGIALVMSISNGFDIYMLDMQTNMLGQYPISIMQQHMDMEAMMTPPQFTTDDKDKFPDGGEVTIPEDEKTAITEMIKQVFHYNRISPDYLEYLKDMPAEYYAEISYKYAMDLNLLTKSVSAGSEEYKPVIQTDNEMTELMYGSSSLFNELANKEFMTSQYDVLEGTYPENKNEIVLLVNEYNEISESLLKSFNLGFNGSFAFSEIIGKEFSMIGHDDWYAKGSNELYGLNENYNASMYNAGTKLKVTGVIRIKEEASVKLYQEGILYHPELTQYAIGENMKSEIGIAQAADKVYNVIADSKGNKVKISDMKITIPMLSGTDISSLIGIDNIDKYNMTMQNLGISYVPKDVVIYPVSFDGKDDLKAYLDAYNAESGLDKIDYLLYNDPSSIMTEMMGEVVDIISIVLVAFASVSLVVSSIMIGIITYVSVVERTKEIGILRSIGARKVDIGRVFNAETAIIGFSAGTLGVIISYLLSIPINLIVKAVSDGVISTNISVLHPLVALILVAISVTLTFLAGIIPSSIAAKKDPVTALRTE